jgi:hypothetical protein
MYTDRRRKMKDIKYLQVGHFLLAVICALLISCDAVTDQDAGENDMGTQFLYGPNASVRGSMEFYVDGEFRSYRKCGWYNDHALVSGYDYRNNDPERLEADVGDGLVGDHDGLIAINKYDYIDGKIKYYQSDEGIGYSAIHVSTNDGRSMEGTFSGTVCNMYDPTECVTITGGIFIAKNVNE